MLGTVYLWTLEATAQKDLQTMQLELFVINIFQYNYTKVQTSGVISEEFMYVYTFLFFILVFLNLYGSIFNFVQ